MVYGTSTSFQAEFEGRIASEVETAPLPESWQKFLSAVMPVSFGKRRVRSGGTGVDGSAAAGLAGADFRSAKTCARSIATSAAIGWSAIFCAAGFGLTTGCACSISPPARAIFRGWWSTSRARSAREVQIDAVDFQASTIEIARELSAGYPGDHVFIARTSITSARSRPTTSCSSRSRCIISRKTEAVTLAAPLPRTFARQSAGGRSAPRLAGQGRRRSAHGDDFSRGDDTNDARVSAARAFSFGELDQLARAAGWEEFRPSPLSFCPAGHLVGACRSDRDSR